METIVGIDLGTTNCSVTAIDENGVTTFNENVKNNQFYIKINNKNSYIEGKIDNTLLNRGDINEK